tara:strand:- start:11961 stop:12152 length:192 start_codon:yes stop_codon:yes gene_type:complete
MAECDQSFTDFGGPTAKIHTPTCIEPPDSEAIIWSAWSEGQHLVDPRITGASRRRNQNMIIFC